MQERVREFLSPPNQEALQSRIYSCAIYATKPVSLWQLLLMGSRHIITCQMDRKEIHVQASVSTYKDRATNCIPSNMPFCGPSDNQHDILFHTGAKYEMANDESKSKLIQNKQN